MEQDFQLIKIDKEGRFVRPLNQLFYTFEKIKIKFFIPENIETNRIPHILTNYQKNKKKSSINVSETKNINYFDFIKQYNIHPCSFEDDLNWTCEMFFDKPGLYFFQVIYVKECKSLSSSFCRKESYYNDFINIKISKNINNIVIIPNYTNDMKNFVFKKHNFMNVISVYPTMLGHFSKWENNLTNILKRNYLGFHFSPIQELGPSKSLYCLKDCEKLNPTIFGAKIDFEVLKNLFSFLKKKYNCFFLIDIVWNHCSIDAEWILEDNFSYFSPENTPHLQIAYNLDQALFDFSKNNKVEEILKKKKIMNIDDVNKIIYYIEKDVIQNLKIENYFMIDIENILDHLKKYFKGNKDKKFNENYTKKTTKINFLLNKDYLAIKDKFYNYGKKQFGVKTKIKEFGEFLVKVIINLNEFEIRRILKDINKEYENKTSNWKNETLNNIKEEVIYRFLQQKNEDVSENFPIVTRYFKILDNGQKAALNGWVMNYDQQEDFILNKNQFYLRRKIVVWGDLIKLRFNGNDKNSYLWRKMKRYTEKMAEVFDGFRLDNFHNSHQKSAKYFIKCARKIKENIFIFSELFTPNTHLQAKLCSNIGVHKTVQEFQNFYNPNSLNQTLKSYINNSASNIYKLPFFRTNSYCQSYLNPSRPNMFIYDQTHDNHTYFQKFNIFMQLPVTAILSFYNKMIGTTVGFDELYVSSVPVTADYEYPFVESMKKKIILNSKKILFLINEEDIKDKIHEKVYKICIGGTFNDWKMVEMNYDSQNGDFFLYINLEVGIYEYKFIVNDKYWTINKNNHFKNDLKDNINNYISVKNLVHTHENLIDIRAYFNKLHIEFCLNQNKLEIESKHDFIIMKRFKKDFKQSTILIARLNYDENAQTSNLDIELPGKFSKVKKIYFFSKKYHIYETGKIPIIKAKINEETSLKSFGVIKRKERNDILKLKEVPQNFVLVIETYYSDNVTDSINYLNDLFSNDNCFLNVLNNLEIIDINYYLYSTDNEERAYWGNGNYNLEGYGTLVYAGFCGIKSFMLNAIKTSDYDHPFFKNLKEHNYLLDYYVRRVKKYRKNTFSKFIDLYVKITEEIKKLPRFLISRYFQTLMMKLITVFEESFLSHITTQEFFKKNRIYRRLLLTLPQFMTLEKNDLYLLSAGLPHFTVGIWKNWGRDTFISFKGIFLINGLFKYGRSIILHYASYYRHGLIPNLLMTSRYNARDATWWFVKSINDYIEFTNDFSILEEKVNMVFLSDIQEEDRKLKEKKITKSKSLIMILQDIFQSHSKGINFREWNAPSIDENMSYNGFDINFFVDWNNGFIFGGNKFNCLTWMDKMGSSKKAGNKGIPASSRHGAPIELTSLLFIGIKMMKMLYDEGFSQFPGVEIDKETCISYRNWKKLIKNNFEKYYWIPENENEFENYIIEEDLVFRKGILKDTYSQTNQDYQLRPNALISLVITPGLISKEKGYIYLKQVETNLIKKHSIGIKTLDPYDDNYVSDYNNDDNSQNFKSAHGFNYHNGPEWVWLYGYYLMAKYILEKKSNYSLPKQIGRLQNHIKWLVKDWLSLPEITNDNGSYCRFSCNSQLWSVACILEAINLLKL